MMLALVPAMGQAEETGQIKNANKISADDLIVTGDICANNDGQTYDVSAPNITVGNKALGVWVAGGSTLNVMTGVEGRLEVDVTNAGNAEGVRSYNGALNIDGGDSFELNVNGGGSVGGLLAKDNSSLSASADNVSVIVNAEANQKGSVTAKGVYFTGNSLQLDASEEINIGVTIKPSAVTNSSSYAAGIENDQSNSHDGFGLIIGSDLTKSVYVNVSDSNLGVSTYGVLSRHDVTKVSGKSVEVSATSAGQATGLTNQWGDLSVGSVGGTTSIKAVGNKAMGILHVIDDGNPTAKAQTTVAGKTINITATGEQLARGADIDGHVNADTMTQKLVLGDETSDITVAVHATGDKAEAAGMLTLYRGASIEVKGKNLNVEAKSEKGNAIGIGAMIGTTEATQSESKIVINSENAVIRAYGDYSAAIQATSQGQILVNGNLDAEADNVIMLRGKGHVGINEAGAVDKVVQLKGNINYNTAEAPTDNAEGDVVLNLMNADSYWTGAVIRTYANNSLSEGNADQSNVKLSLSNGAQWTPKHVEDEQGEDSGVILLSLDSLVMNDGVINITEGEKQVVKIDSMTGRGGSVNVKATTDGETLKAGKLEIGTTAEGSSLDVGFTGITADDVTDAKKVMESAADVVTANGATVNQKISEGAIKGEITQTIGADGQTGEVVQAENTKLLSMHGVTSLAAFQWRHDMNDLTKRMGELRTSPEGIGTWARIYGSEQEHSGATAKNHSVQIGLDAGIGAGWKTGVAFTYTDGSTELTNGDADNKSWGLGVYGSWMAENGAFVDLIGKYSRMSTDYQISGMDAGFDNNALSVSAEFGWHLKLSEVGFVEPQLEVTCGRIFGDDYTAANGVRVEQDDFDSLIGRAGVRAGFYFPEKRGVVYARGSVLHDFQGETGARASLVSDSSVYERLEDDLGGTWYELGIGGNFNLTDRTYTYVDLEKTFAGPVVEDWRFNIGIRSVF